MTRFLAVDVGSKRIGLAVGDDQTRVASPVTTLRVQPDWRDDVNAIQAVAAEYEVDAFVVGLPRNMDLTEGPQAKLTRTFGQRLARVTGKVVHYFDERLSSVTADELLQPADLTRKQRKAVQDAVAAQVILQEFFDTQRS